MPKEVRVSDEDLQPAGTRNTIDVVIKGGPLARSKDFELSIDGAPLKHARHLELIADVDDVIMLRTEQILVYADVNVKVGGWEKGAVADVRLWDGTEQTKIEGRGKTPIEAMRNAVHQMEEKGLGE